MAFTQPRRNNIGNTLILKDDKIGIGTSTPNQKLTVDGTISLKEQADANSDTAAYGQLWVNTATPNELYFTTDAGNDIQLTSGTSIAGGGGGGGGGSLDNVSEDTSPQLGGNLDVNGNDIISASNGDIDLDPNGTGVVVFKGNSTKGSGQFKLNCEQNSHGITVKGPPHSASASYTLTLPNDTGSNNQVLKTDGSGSLSWVNQSGGGGGAVSAVANGSDNRIATFSSSDALNGEANLTFDGNILNVSGTVIADNLVEDITYNTKTLSNKLLTDTNSWKQLGNKIIGEPSNGGSGVSVSLSADGTIVAIGADYNDAGGTDKGHVRVHEYNGSFWTQLGSDIDGEADYDYSGHSVSLSADGTIVAIGADGNNSTRGHARVYKYNGSDWAQLGSDIDGEAANDWSGWSLSLSSDGTIVAIGAYENDGNGTGSGHVRVHEYNGSAWVQLGSDIDGEAAGDESGGSVSLSNDGKIVAIGAYKNNNYYRGHIRVYKYNGSAWVQLGSDIDGGINDAGDSGDRTGFSVSLSGNGYVVADGQYGDGIFTYTTGRVRVFQYNGSDWVQLGSNIEAEADHDKCGYSVSLNNDGTIIAIGSIGADHLAYDTGHVRMFQYSSGNWTQLGSKLMGEPVEDDFYGTSVSLSGDGSIVAIGAPGDDTTGNTYTPKDGYVKIFSLTNHSHNITINNHLTIGNTHSKSYTVTCSFAHNGDNSIITEVCKIPARSIITSISSVVKTLSNLGTYLVNLSLSTSTGTAADGALANASTTITVPEILGAGANNTYQQNSAIVMGGTAADIVLSSGGTTKVVYYNKPNTTIVGTADVYLYVCNAGTSNGTTNPSTSGVLEVYIKYIGLD